MEVKNEMSVFKNKVETRTVNLGGSQEFTFSFKDGFDFTKILDVKTTCGCTAPLIYKDRVTATYHDDGQISSDADIEFKEKYIYVFFMVPGIPEDQQPKVDIVNARGQSVYNYEELPWELLTIRSRVVRK